MIYTTALELLVFPLLGRPSILRWQLIQLKTAIKHLLKSFRQLLGCGMRANPWNCAGPQVMQAISSLCTCTLLKTSNFGETFQENHKYRGMNLKSPGLLVCTTSMQPRYLIQKPWWEVNIELRSIKH